MTSVRRKWEVIVAKAKAYLLSKVLGDICASFNIIYRDQSLEGAMFTDHESILFAILSSCSMVKVNASISKMGGAKLNNLNSISGHNLLYIDI